MQNAEAVPWELFHDVAGPRIWELSSELMHFWKLLNDWCCLPRERNWLRGLHDPHANPSEKLGLPIVQTPAPKISPWWLTPGAGSVSRLRVASLLGLISRTWFPGIIQRALVIYPFNGLYLLNSLADHRSHQSQWTKPTPRHHHLLPDSYTILLTGPPASTFDPKHQRSMGGCQFAKLSETFTVISMDMGYWNLSVSNTSSTGKKWYRDISFPSKQLKGYILPLINARSCPFS